jgi:hypothetical protein
VRCTLWMVSLGGHIIFCNHGVQGSHSIRLKRQGQALFSRCSSIALERIDFVDSIRLLSCLSRLFVVLIIGMQLPVVFFTAQRTQKKQHMSMSLFDALPSRIKLLQCKCR